MSTGENVPADASVRTGLDEEALAAGVADKLHFHQAVPVGQATRHDWYMALALAVRDRLVDRYLRTIDAVLDSRAKVVAYLSAEFLTGPQLGNNLINLGIWDAAARALSRFGQDIGALLEEEEEPGLGNGGLGRLAACYMESMASVGLAGFGYGIRYDHGLFRQQIRDGWQIEMPEDWLTIGNPWEFERAEVTFPVGFGGRVEPKDGTGAQPKFVWKPAEYVIAVAFDTPVVGLYGHRINTLRLWSARPSEPMQFDEFNRGQHLDAFAEQVRATNISRVLYPDDSTPAGQELRLKQEYFFTSASLQDMVRRHISQYGTIANLPKAATVQLNDTHPALAVAELVRILVDEHGYVLSTALELTRATIAYTNHTLLPEALESWPVQLMERLLPRHMQIIYEINALHLGSVANRREISKERLHALSLIEEGNGRRVRMGHLAFVGSRRVNGVSGLHGQLLRETVFQDLNNLYPDRITHITNGVTFRRWLVQCNPALTRLINEAIGTGWIGDADRLSELESRVRDSGFLERFAKAKRSNKERLAAAVARRLQVTLDPDAMFDVHIKRMHEYKRQLLNILEAVAHYEAIKAAPTQDWVPRVKIFAGKAAASYHRAKLIIKLINDVARMVNTDPVVRDKLRVVFLPNYNVSLAELIIPAADLSEQISTAGMEASGTGNMKLALNGALTIGTYDGANIEINERVGADNILIFGLNAAEVAARRRDGNDARVNTAACSSLAGTLEAIRSGVFSPDEPDRYAQLVDDLYNHDFFMVTADFAAYAAKQREADAGYQQRNDWARRALLNTARMGWFSSDRAIREYATEIWGAVPDGQNGDTG